MKSFSFFVTLLSNNVVFNETKKEALVGSRQMWKFSESVVLGKHAQSYKDEEEEATAADERAPFKVPIEERVAEKLKQMGVVIPKSIAIQIKPDAEEIEENPKEGI